MDNQVVLDVAFLTVVVAPLLPILVGVLTKKLANSSVKAAMLLFFSAVTGVLNQAVLDHGVLTKETVVASFVAFVIATASHYGFLKPISVTGSDGVVQNKTSEVGIG